MMQILIYVDGVELRYTEARLKAERPALHGNLLVLNRLNKVRGEPTLLLTNPQPVEDRPTKVGQLHYAYDDSDTEITCWTVYYSCDKSAGLYTVLDGAVGVYVDRTAEPATTPTVEEVKRYGKKRPSPQGPVYTLNSKPVPMFKSEGGA